ncbi:MAG: zinc-ribbon domain-containing protein [Clostridia bacterium]|nr:zinc-ribbon domain-containing protein [Clostridia bacterium]
MKYCQKCGNELLDEAVMCPKCGCTVEGKQPTKEQKEKSKNQAIGAILIIAAVAIVVVTVLLAMSQW